MKNKFTLIELIAVILIIGILSSMIIPNIASFRGDAQKVAIASNIKSLQTAVDMYSLDNYGKLPTKVQPTIGNPQYIDFTQMYPKYIRDIPNILEEHYWVDVFGTTWGSLINTPDEVAYTSSNVSWRHTDGATSYEVIQIQESSVTGSVNKSMPKFKIKSLDVLNVIPENNPKIISYPKPTNEDYFVSAYDKFGFPTPPVGENYKRNTYIELISNVSPESMTTLPLTETGTYFITTNASAMAVWDGIQTSEIKPTGTDIQYSFATSNDGVNWSTFSTDINSLPNSQYMKVKIDMTGTTEKQPTLKHLKVLFHLVEDEVVPVDLVNDMKQSTNVTPVNNKLELNSGSTEGSTSHTISLGDNKQIDKVNISKSEPSNSSITTTYQSSSDGGVTWSEPTPFPEQLPAGDTLRINNTYKKDSISNPSPSIDNILISSSNPKSNTTQPEQPPVVEEWTTLKSLSLQFDAGETGDWISTIITDYQPSLTRIIYEYSTSDDGITWSSKGEDITTMSNSRHLKVDITLQKQQSATENPKFTEILVNYKLQDGTLKSTTLTDNQAPTAVITMNPEQALTTTTTITWDYSSSTDAERDSIVNAEWKGKQDIYTIEGQYTVELRVQDSKGAWSDWVSKTFYVIDNFGIKQIEGGNNHTVVLMNDGTVKSWGRNHYGQLGNGSATDSYTPVIVSGLTNVKQISAGNDFTMAVLNDGILKAWGFNNNGQLGDGSKLSQTKPVTVLNISNVKQVEAGHYHTVALLNDGTVKAWGYNDSGQLGNGTISTNTTTVPATVSGLNNVIQIASKNTFTLALLNDGTVKAWGSNGYNQLGSDMGTPSYTPKTVIGVSNVKQISVGYQHSLALLNDGRVMVWGGNTQGQLGLGSINQARNPIVISGLNNVKQVEAGEYHSLALLNDGTVKAWGYNSHGQTGPTTSSTPTTITGLTNVQHIATGYRHSIASLNDGSIKTLGNNEYGQLGDGTTINKNSPVLVQGLK